MLLRQRLEINAGDWQRLGKHLRGYVGRKLAAFTFTVTWSDVRNAKGDVVLHRSSPLWENDAIAASAVLRDETGLVVSRHPVFCYGALAAVMLRGTRVVMGAGSPMLSAHDAETRGTPVAVIERDGRVTPWEGVAFGHTDDELRAAPLLTRARHADAGGAR